jgi:hypothetical protein
MIAGLLKSVAAKGMEGKPPPTLVVYERQDPATAPALVKYLWYKVMHYIETYLIFFILTAPVSNK